MTDNPPMIIYPDTPADCPEVPYPEHMLRWFDLCDEYPYLKLLCGFPLQEPVPPGPMSREQFRQLVGAIKSKDQRAILQELLLDLLGEGIAEIVTALVEARDK